MGSLAAEKPEHGKPLSGILIKRGFNYHLIGPDDLQSKSVNEIVYEKVVRLTTSAAEKISCKMDKCCQRILTNKS